MLCIDEAGDSAAFLYFGYHMERYGCFTGRLRSIYLNNSSLRHTAKAECDIQA